MGCLGGKGGGGGGGGGAVLGPLLFVLYVNDILESIVYTKQVGDICRWHQDTLSY